MQSPDKDTGFNRGVAACAGHMVLKKQAVLDVPINRSVCILSEVSLLKNSEKSL